MTRTLRKMSHRGDESIASWDTETVSADRLAEIECEYKRLTSLGWWAVDITDKRDVIVKDFDPYADTLLISPVSGG